MRESMVEKFQWILDCRLFRSFSHVAMYLCIVFRSGIRRSIHCPFSAVIVSHSFWPFSSRFQIPVVPAQSMSRGNVASSQNPPFGICHDFAASVRHAMLHDTSLFHQGFLCSLGLLDSIVFCPSNRWEFSSCKDRICSLFTATKGAFPQMLFAIVKI